MVNYHANMDGAGCLVCNSPSVELVPVKKDQPEKRVPLCHGCGMNVSYYGWGAMMRDFSGLERRLGDYGWKWVDGILTHDSKRRSE